MEIVSKSDYAIPSERKNLRNFRITENLKEGDVVICKKGGLVWIEDNDNIINYPVLYEKRSLFFKKIIFLKKVPENGLSILCPNHNDTHPSAKIWNNGNINCFKCGFIPPKKGWELTNGFSEYQ